MVEMTVGFILKANSHLERSVTQEEILISRSFVGICEKRGGFSQRLSLITNLSFRWSENVQRNLYFDSRISFVGRNNT